ncbi:MAG: hypothetical protein ACLP52_13015 [Streptosporangiaceae bacterium]
MTVPVYEYLYVKYTVGTANYDPLIKKARYAPNGQSTGVNWSTENGLFNFGNISVDACDNSGVTQGWHCGTAEGP